jgi:hypothetical protein
MPLTDPFFSVNPFMGTCGTSFEVVIGNVGSPGQVVQSTKVLQLNSYQRLEGFAQVG